MDGYEVKLYFSPEDDYYVAQIVEFVGCAAAGPTAQEALDNLREVKSAWIDSMKRMGHSIPPPRHGQVEESWKGRQSESVLIAA